MKRPYINYFEYINSDIWREKKKHWIKLFGDKCVCGKKGENLHHRHYKNLGTEPPHQLVLLCRKCHAFVHGLPSHTTNKKIMKLNLRKLLRLYRPKPSPSGMRTGGVLKTIN